MSPTWRTIAIPLTFAAALVACADDSDSTSDSSGATDSRPAAATTANGASTTDLGVNDRIEAATEALNRGDFSTMLQFLALTSLGDEIEDRPVTILAPNDNAFSSLSRDDLSNLLTNPTELDDVLRRHVLEGAISLAELKTKSEVTTIGGDTLPVVVNGDTVTIDGAVVSEVDSEMTEGTGGQDLAVYGLDKVLLIS